jgi:hypothetical protein
MIDPINGYDYPRNLLKTFSFFIPKILKILKKTAAVDRSVDTKKPTAGHPDGRATPEVHHHLTCLLRLIYSPSQPPCTHLSLKWSTMVFDPTTGKTQRR